MVPRFYHNIEESHDSPAVDASLPGAAPATIQISQGARSHRSKSDQIWL